jgi:hypothetical protein
MNKGRQFKLVAIGVLVALMWMTSKASAAQCGSTAAGFEVWKRQFAGEAQARGVSASTIAALMGTTYSTATIAAYRGQRTFSLSLDQFLAKRGGSAIVTRGRALKQSIAALFTSIQQRFGVPPGRSWQFGEGSGFREVARKSERSIGGGDSRLRLPSHRLFRRAALRSSDTDGARNPFSGDARLHAW